MISVRRYSMVSRYLVLVAVIQLVLGQQVTQDSDGSTPRIHDPLSQHPSHFSQQQADEVVLTTELLRQRELLCKHIASCAGTYPQISEATKTNPAQIITKAVLVKTQTKLNLI